MEVYMCGDCCYKVDFVLQLSCGHVLCACECTLLSDRAGHATMLTQLSNPHSHAWYVYFSCRGCESAVCIHRGAVVMGSSALASSTALERSSNSSVAQAAVFQLQDVCARCKLYCHVFTFLKARYKLVGQLVHQLASRGHAQP